MKLFFSILLLAITTLVLGQPSPVTKFDSIHYQNLLKKRAALDSLRLSKSLSYMRERVANPDTVTTLVFKNSPIGELPKEIANFSNLKKVVFYKCNKLDFSQAFQVLAQNQQLEDLRISFYNKRSLSDNIGLLPNLKKLEIGNGKLTSFPDSLSKCSKLETLVLKNNPYLQFAGNWDVIGKLSEVKAVDLSYCQLSEIPASILSLPNIEELDISNNVFVNLPLENTLPSLKSINLSYNVSLDQANLMQWLANSADLESLYLEGLRIDALDAGIGNLSNLRRLALKDNLLNNLPLTMGKLLKLEYLDLSTARQSNIKNLLIEVPEFFKNFKSLTYLNLSGNKLKKYPDFLESLKNLEWVNLSFNELESFPLALLKSLKLKHLNLSLNKIHNIPPGIGNLHSLEYLNIDGNFFNVHIYKIKYIPEELGKLSKLKILRLNDNVVEELPSSLGDLKALKELHLRGNLLNTFPEVLSGLESLKKLDLKANEIESMPEIPNVEELNLAFNPLLNYKIVLAKLEMNPNLKRLDLSYNNVDPTLISSFKKKNQGCVVIKEELKQTNRRR